jgi:hypothetical protein
LKGFEAMNSIGFIHAIAEGNTKSSGQRHSPGNQYMLEIATFMPHITVKI